MGKHYTDLDGMRGILAVVVMLYHYGLNTLLEKLSAGAIRAGEWGLCVDFFFLLSGFVLALSFNRELPNLAAYAEKRVRRLAPAFLLTTIWVLLIPGQSADLLELAANGAMVQSLFNIRSINYPGWSVPFELVVPAVGLAMWSVFMRRPVIVFSGAMIVGAAAAYLLVLGHDIPWLRATSGIWGGFALFELRHRVPSFKHPGFVALVLLTACILVMLFAKTLPALAMLFLPVAAMTVAVGARGRTVLSTQPFQAVGRWSYGIYLVHVPVLLTAALLLGTADGVATKLGMAVVTIMLAGLLYRFIEVPLMGRRRPAGHAAPAA